MEAWEVIGHTEYGNGDTKNVPEWVLRAFDKHSNSHDGAIHYFKGKHHRYKVTEKGQGGPNVTFYRRPSSKGG
jgi:hypothetical protein